MENKVWKVGSRWSGNGLANTSLLRIFRRNGVVFIGQKNRLDMFGTIKKGDYLAICDGKDIVCVARSLDDKPSELSQMIKDGIIRFKETDKIGELLAADVFKDCEQWNEQPLGVRVHIVECNRKTYDRGTLQHIWKKDIVQYVLDSYNAGNSASFDIQSSTYTLCKSDKDKKSIIDSNTYFNIPIYQREYAWQEEQVSRFIRDIFNGYRLNEPMFIGTMQLSAPQFIFTDEYEQDVIDGQQRLSTMFCLLKYLQLRYSDCKQLKDFRINWLETRVNNGKENELLNKLKNITHFEDLVEPSQNDPNKYISNTVIIDSIFDEQLRDDNGIYQDLDSIDKFVQYITTKLFFVVIETHAGLSKTIQIFNTINTAGLDLNGDDLFKVRLFEYLKDKHNAKDQTFDEISNFYGKVKDVNEKWLKEGHSEPLVSVQEIRTIYKDYLVAQYELDSQAFDMGSDNFFDLLFDQILGIQDQTSKLSTKSKDVILKLSDLYDILAIEEEWNRHLKNLDNAQQFIDVQMLNYSRYARFRRIAYQVMWQNKDNPNRIHMAHQILALFSRISYCESIRWSKVVSGTATKMKNLYKSLYSQSFELTIETAQKYLVEYAKDIQNCIGRQIFENGKCHRTWGNLICVLSECLAILEDNSNITHKDIKEHLFSKAFDFEHIHATNDKKLVGIPSDLQNSIGNLMLLEYDINRSIGNISFKEKCLRYPQSKYITAHRIANMPEWGETQIIFRKNQEIDKITKWIINTGK